MQTGGVWGRIANHDHRSERILCTFLLPGPPAPHTWTSYTRHPKDPDRLAWKRDDDIAFSFHQISECGLNTIKFSYFGHEGETDRWGTNWLFSQTRWSADHEHAAGAHYTEAEQIAQGKHFFRMAHGQGLLVAPLLEVSPRFPFWKEFPDHLDNLVERVSWLLQHFGKEPNWLSVYDQNSQPRQVVWLIETIHGSDIDPSLFASGFEKASLEIRRKTGCDVGFIIDPKPLPAYGSVYGPEPTALRRCPSILAIDPFNITAQGEHYKAQQSEITEEERLQHAESFLRHWSASGIPVLAPLSPGYDGHIVFPKNGVYGFNPAWRQRQKEIALRCHPSGLSIDMWNGWTEGYGIPASTEDGDINMNWVRDVVTCMRALP